MRHALQVVQSAVATPNLRSRSLPCGVYHSPAAIAGGGDAGGDGGDSCGCSGGDNGGNEGRWRWRWRRGRSRIHQGSYTPPPATCPAISIYLGHNASVKYVVNERREGGRESSRSLPFPCPISRSRMLHGTQMDFPATALSMVVTALLRHAIVALGAAYGAIHHNLIGFQFRGRNRIPARTRHHVHARMQCGDNLLPNIARRGD